jgi:hypothetical protein
MALNNFGIKEVADVRFYPANALKLETTETTVDGVTTSTTGLKWTVKTKGDGKNTQDVYYSNADKKLEFTTLKVSNLSITSETSDARGGKGNAKLLSWDHSREGTITLEDALLSLDCLEALMGDGSGGTDEGFVKITSDSFANNYCIVGTTFARDQATGQDHLFTFFVPNAKVSTELNLEMSADGDPTVFNMELNILRASKEDGTMVALIAAPEEYDKTSGSIFDSVIPEDETPKQGTT